MADFDWGEGIAKFLTGATTQASSNIQSRREAELANQQAQQKMMFDAQTDIWKERIKNQMKQSQDAEFLKTLTGGMATAQTSPTTDIYTQPQALSPQSVEGGISQSVNDIITPPTWKQYSRGGVTVVNPNYETYQQRLATKKLLTRKNIVEETNLGKKIMIEEGNIAQKRADLNPIMGDIDRVLGFWKEIPGYQKGPVKRWMPFMGLGAASLRTGGRDIIRDKSGRAIGIEPIVGEKLTPEKQREFLSRMSPEELTDPELKKTASPLSMYEDTKVAILGNIAKKFAGEAGVLTDADLKRIEKMWPKQEDDDATAYRKIANLKEFIGSRVRSYEKEKVRLISSWKERRTGPEALRGEELGNEQVIQSQDDAAINSMLDQLGAD